MVCPGPCPWASKERKLHVLAGRENLLVPDNRMGVFSSPDIDNVLIMVSRPSNFECLYGAAKLVREKSGNFAFRLPQGFVKIMKPLIFHSEN